MNNNDIRAREAEILYEIYKHKVMTVEQLHSLFFQDKTLYAPRNYLLRLTKQGLLRRMFAITKTDSGRAEQIFMLDRPGINLLREKGFKTGSGQVIPRHLISCSEAQIRHDLKLVDIIIYLYSGNMIDEYVTELFLRQIRYSEKKNYRIPDFIFKDKNGYGFVELEEVPRHRKKLFADIKSYRQHFKDFRTVFVVQPGRVDFYKEVLSNSALTNWEIHNWTDKKLVKKHPL